MGHFFYRGTYRKKRWKMVFEEKEYMLGEKKILLRSAKPEEAQLLVDYLKTVCGETRFLLCDPDEVKYTAESEVEFINSKNSSEDSMLMLAFVDGEYAGNCSFQPIGSRRRARHRVDIGIALYQKYTGFGLGRLMLEQLLFTIKELGYEQAELTVVGGNNRAYHLYESLGFKECGRIPKANKYQDGTYADDIHMVKEL
jgi:RimJ/RimL family protein N-acetyltransferase